MGLVILASVLRISGAAGGVWSAPSPAAARVQATIDAAARAGRHVTVVLPPGVLRYCAYTAVPVFL